MQSIPRSNTLRSRRARYNSMSYLECWYVEKLIKLSYACLGDPSALVTRNDGLVLSGGNQQHSGSIGGTGAAGNGSSSNGSKNGTLKHPTSNSSTDRVRGGNRMMTRKTTAAVPGRKWKMSIAFSRSKTQNTYLVAKEYSTGKINALSK